MQTMTSVAMTAALLALSLIAGTSAFAESKRIEDPKAEAEAFLASPISLSQAILAADTETGGKVISVEYQTGDGSPDLIMADVVMADGSDKTVALNPADGKLMTATGASDEQDEGENDSEGDEGENG
jgi:uncharacterized membrane protein YkoI